MSFKYFPIRSNSNRPFLTHGGWYSQPLARRLSQTLVRTRRCITGLAQLCSLTKFALRPRLDANSGPRVGFSELAGHILEGVPNIRHGVNSSLFTCVKTRECGAKADLVNLSIVKIDRSGLVHNGLRLDGVGDFGQDSNGLGPGVLVGGGHGLRVANQLRKTGNDHLDISGLLELLGEWKDNILKELSEKTCAEVSFGKTRYTKKYLPSAEAINSLHQEIRTGALLFTTSEEPEESGESGLDNLTSLGILETLEQKGQDGLNELLESGHRNDGETGFQEVKAVTFGDLGNHQVVEDSQNRLDLVVGNNVRRITSHDDSEEPDKGRDIAA